MENEKIVGELFDIFEYDLLDLLHQLPDAIFDARLDTLEPASVLNITRTTLILSSLKHYVRQNLPQFLPLLDREDSYLLTRCFDLVSSTGNTTDSNYPYGDRHQVNQLSLIKMSNHIDYDSIINHIYMEYYTNTRSILSIYELVPHKLNPSLSSRLDTLINLLDYIELHNFNDDPSLIRDALIHKIDYLFDKISYGIRKRTLRLMSYSLIQETLGAFKCFVLDNNEDDFNKLKNIFMIAREGRAIYSIQ